MGASGASRADRRGDLAKDTGPGACGLSQVGQQHAFMLMVRGIENIPEQPPPFRDSGD